MSSTRSFLVWPLAWAAVLFLVMPASGADEAALRAALDRLAGEWTGEAQVKAMDGFILKTVPVTRRAAWNAGTLVVETTLSDGTSDYVVVARQAIRLGRLESSVSRPSQPEDRYLGEVVGGALVWTNAEGNRRDAREQVAERGGSLVLETSSVEPIRALGLSGLVRMEVKYQRPAPAVASEATIEVAPGLEAEVLAQRARADEAERRAAVAEGRLQTLEGNAAEARASEERLKADLQTSRQQIAQLESERASTGERLLAVEALSTGAAREAAAGAEVRRGLEVRVAELDSELAAVTREREQFRARLATLESAAAQAQRDNERLLTANQRLEQDRGALESQLKELQLQVAAQPAPAATPAVVPTAPVAVPESGAAFSAAMRDKLITEVQQMERRVIELESERNAMREQLALGQRQLDETRRLRDDTLVRFQTVVSELNAMREEKERLARANVSLQAEVRTAQQGSRSAGPIVGDGNAQSATGTAAPATTLDGKTADMVIAALQIIGVTRGDGGEDKAILDGRLYRSGDLVEAQLGIVFARIEDNSLVFQDRRGREYRRRF